MQAKWSSVDGVSVIGITGHARHGKDTLAQALMAVRPGAERWALSDAVAVVARVYHGMGARDAWTLQTVGTAMRMIDPSVWLRCVHGAIADKRPPLAVITGVRYPDEAQMVRDMGGVIVGIGRASAPALIDRDPSHVVESHIDQLLSTADLVYTAPNVPDAVTLRRTFEDIARNILDAVRR
jgi:hypothetical protein